MVSVESYPGGCKHKLSPGLFAKLRSHRVHRLLTNFGKFNRLAKDAVEKLGGEFVIDMRYPLFLMDNALGLADEILQDANVLTSFRHNREAVHRERSVVQTRFEYNRSSLFSYSGCFRAWRGKMPAPCDP